VREEKKERETVGEKKKKGREEVKQESLLSGGSLGFLSESPCELTFE
jgi:hypothetical protein